MQKPVAKNKSTQRTTSSKNRSNHKPAPRNTKAAPKTRAKTLRGQAIGLEPLSPERRLDIIAVMLGLAGFLSLLAFIPAGSGTAQTWLLTPLLRFFGWGAALLPVYLIGIAVWLLLRGHTWTPAMSTERWIGLGLLFFNLLTWSQYLTRAALLMPHGGGWLGGLLERLLVSAFGVLGSAIALFAWFLISLMLVLDISLPDLVKSIRSAYSWLNARIKQERLPASVEPAVQQTAVKPALAQESKTLLNLNLGFKPLDKSSAKPARSAGGKETPPEAPPETPALEPAKAVVKSTLQATWRMPDMKQVLDPASPQFVQSSIDKERARVIEETLASFNVPVHVTDIQHGPTVTMFGVEPDFVSTRGGMTRVRVSKITGLTDDIALALAAPSIRLQAPVPGRNYVGIEVPNAEVGRVSLREILESETYKKKRSPLAIALGKNVSGKPVVADLADLPHLLIAGTTGSGKSVCINSILSCFLLNNSPHDLRLVLVDPKRVELTGYNGIPHLLGPVVTSPEQVIGALQWMQREMDSRYQRFSKSGVRNIEDFNQRFPEEHLPYLIIVIDELADLMMLAPEETERSIARLAQLARATGIHLILATQRPSVDVVTGLIKANLPARIAFAVASGVDSRVILDQPGAERLLGRGDMLYQAPDAPGPVRLQGVYVSDAEIQLLVDHWHLEATAPERKDEPAKENLEADMMPKGLPLKQVPLWEDAGESSEDDPVMTEAVDLVRREGRASITMLQRRMRIGYSRAARLIDAMEERGIISPQLPNSATREVLDYGQAAPPPED